MLVILFQKKGIESDEEKVSKVLEWPQPKSREEIRHFSGFVGYYRKFIIFFFKNSQTCNRSYAYNTKEKPK